MCFPEHLRSAPVTETAQAPLARHPSLAALVWVCSRKTLRTWLRKIPLPQHRPGNTCPGKLISKRQMKGKAEYLGINFSSPRAPPRVFLHHVWLHQGQAGEFLLGQQFVQQDPTLWSEDWNGFIKMQLRRFSDHAHLSLRLRRGLTLSYPMWKQKQQKFLKKGLKTPQTNPRPI